MEVTFKSFNEIAVQLGRKQPPNIKYYGKRKGQRHPGTCGETGQTKCTSEMSAWQYR